MFFRNFDRKSLQRFICVEFFNKYKCALAFTIFFSEEFASLWGFEWKAFVARQNVYLLVRWFVGNSNSRSDNSSGIFLRA